MTGPFDGPRDHPPSGGVDPAWDPAVRRRVTASVTALYRVMDDVLYRRRDPATGQHAEPEPVSCGDLTGLCNAVLLEVVAPIRAALDQVSGTIGTAVTDMYDYRRSQYGPGYQPDLSSWPPPGEDSRGNRRGGAAA